MLGAKTLSSHGPGRTGRIVFIEFHGKADASSHSCFPKQNCRAAVFLFIGLPAKSKSFESSSEVVAVMHLI